ncbi:hypothetical protein JOQ06_004198 [Pogonophryne albipinna]|uniref:B box-type domain-containing protein n=1 Tax=Pogonophryne albipinna TaxID=1090488 RepID=A0AAD6F3A6_9TELE|nr:hypothetical protein JOQ06_004198 [Pogonophryne albipinna]
MRECSSCDSPSAKCWCVDCNEALCNVCVSAHRRVSVTRTHHLLNHHPPAGGVCPPPIKFCRLHPSEPLQLYQFVSEALDSLKKQLEVRVQPIRAWGVRVGRSLQDMESRLQELSSSQLNLQQELQRSYGILTNILKDRMDNLLREAEV